MPPAIAGALLLASLVWDGLVDPFVGDVADRSGSYGRIIMIGAPCAALCFFALFAGPYLGLSGWIAAGVGLFAFRTAYSALDVPHNALLARIAPTTAVRGRIAGARFIFSSLASLTVGATLPSILDVDRRAEALGAIALWAGASAVCASALIMMSWWAVRKWDVPGAGAPAPSGPNATLFVRIGAPLENPSVRMLLLLGAIGGATTPMFPKMALYYATYIGGDAQLASNALMSLAVGQLIGTPIWIWISVRLARARAIAAAHAGVGACGMIIALASPQTVVSLAAAAVLYGVAASGVYTIIWSMAVESVDDHEARTGRRSEGAIFALLIMTMQFAAGMGSALIGVGLGAVSYVPGQSPSDTLSKSITFLSAGVPAIGAIVSILICAFYPAVRTIEGDEAASVGSGSAKAGRAQEIGETD